MRSRSVTAGYVLAVLISAVFAFLFLRAVDADGPVWDGGSQLRVDGTAAPVESASRLYADLEELATDRGVDVVRIIADAEHPGALRHLYVADGGGIASGWLRDGYDAVAPSGTSTVAPLEALGELDPRGSYLVGGSTADGRAVLAALEAAGWQGELQPYPSASSLDSYRAYGDLLRVLLVAVLGVLVLVGAGTVLRGRAHGVQRLNGAGLPRILLGEWRALALPVLGLSALGVALVAAGLLAVNGLAQLPVMLPLFGHLGTLLGSAAVAAHVAGIALTDGARLLDQLKGRVDGWWVLVAVHAVRVPAVLVLLAVVAALGQSARIAEAEGRTRAYWESAGDAVVLGLSGYRSEEDARALTPALAAMVLAQADRGGVVLAAQGTTTDPGLLLVDEGYLRRVEVIDAQGARITDVVDGAITVLSPASVPEERLRKAREGIGEWQSVQAAVSDPAPATAGLALESRALRDGQSLFTFRTGGGGALSETTITDPILVVLPSLSYIAPSEIFSAVSVGAIAFTDPASMPAAIVGSGLDDLVVSVEPVAFRANEEYRKALGALSVNVLGLIGAALVVVLTGVVAAVITQEKDRQRAFVHHLSGLPPLSAHRGALALEGALLLGVLVEEIARTTAHGPDDPRAALEAAAGGSATVLAAQSATSAVVVALSAAVFVGSLALAHRRSARPRPLDD